MGLFQVNYNYICGEGEMLDKLEYYKIKCKKINL